MIKRIYIHTGDDAAQCKCSFAHRMVGDGCDVCNPELAKELAEPTEADMLRAELEDTQRVAHYQRETIAAHLSSIDSQRSIIKSLSERNIALTKENESLKARIRGYDADCHGMQQRIVAQSDALEAKDDVIARMRDTLIAKDKKITEQAAVINHLSKANVEELEDRIHDLEVKLNFARVALS
jgi:predicted RNase H-like nuclease (RuvC/YqgF family)